ncbi:MAG: hypothetical protein V1763_00620 [Parcubacteria group bacterium]
MPYISIDYSWIFTLGSMPFYEIIWTIFINGGWAIFAFTILWGVKANYYYVMEDRFYAKQNYVLLAIDVPKENLQTPRAVENIFVAISGMQGTIEWFEKLKGEAQLGVSCEIVSIDGFIQFIIRTPVQFRNLVEASVYSQYPDAEITEVSDYTADFDVHFPSDEYNLFGADLMPVNKDYFPFFTYIQFQEFLDKEFKDPMAAFLEVLSKIGPGEQIWFQMLIAPAAPKYEKKGVDFVLKKLKLTEPLKKSMLDKIVESPITALTMLHDELVGAEPAEKKKDEKFNMMFLPPHEKREVEEVLRKIDKVCYHCKLRWIYLGKREVFKKTLGVSGVMGAMKQFSSSALNSWKPGKNKTKPTPWQEIFGIGKWVVARKQNAVLRAYKRRYPMTYGAPYLLNVEELATMYHFPALEVRAPMVKRVESKHTRAPMGLPTVEGEQYASLPVESQAGKETPVDVYNTDYFENRFAVDKTRATDRARKEQILKQLAQDKKTVVKTEPSLRSEEVPRSMPNVKPLTDDQPRKNVEPPVNLPIA